MEEVYNTEKAKKGQIEYCKRTGAPHFAPQDGYCWKCGRDIYAPETRKNDYTGKEFQIGISVKEASESLVTGCPFCHRSYCE